MRRKQPLSAMLVVALVGGMALSGSAAVAPTTNDATASSISHSVPVTVTSVTDGDTVDVEYENGTTETVRLLGVDTPEVHADNSPEEFEGVPDTQAGADCLADAGEDASQYATDELLGEQVTLQFDGESDRRGDFGRLLGYISVDGENFNHDLLELGHARVYDSTFGLSDSFYGTETTAQDSLTGLWDCRTVDDGDSGQASVEWVYAEADYLNEERVEIKNTGDGELDLSSYTLEDEVGHSYTFPDGFTLAPGASVWVHSGSGDADADDLYADFGYEVWNDDGDTATLYDEDGDVADSRSY